ncbi:MAG: hypothetical protein RBG13Loki_1517 [Promethearchaeota archaeon CR_4]|nr:MAG: hypothetical protein RBG13Loki_1517 [Candidatus Lokiarchaeota archaeon CR_4]
MISLSIPHVNRPNLDVLNVCSVRRFITCWRAADLENYGVENFGNGWRINGEGLVQLHLAGYRITVDGEELEGHRGDFHESLLALLATGKGKQQREESPLTPVRVMFLRSEKVILGADLQEYGPFHAGEMASLPRVHAEVFVRNAAAVVARKK